MHGLNVTRTLSGTLIPHNTRQPTPEPSDTGSHDGEFEATVFEADHDTSSAFPEMDLVPDRTEDHDVETPWSSQALADRSDCNLTSASVPTSPNSPSDDPANMVCVVCRLLGEFC